MPHDVQEILTRLAPGKFDAKRAANFDIERARGRLESSFPVERLLNFDAEARTAEFVFATDQPIEHWFGNVILDVDPANVNIDRVQNGICPFLVNHDINQHAGVVLKDSIELGPNIRGKVKFSRSALGQQILNDIEDGVRNGTSIGFLIHDLILEREEEGEMPVYRAKKWEMLENSSASIPADIGSHRGFEKPPVSEDPASERAISDSKEENTMSKTAEEIAAETAAVKPRAVEATRSADLLVMDEIREYGEALKASEIAEAYIRDCVADNGTFTGTKTGLFARIKAATPVAATVPLQNPADAAKGYSPAQVDERTTLGQRLVQSDKYKNADKGKGSRVDIRVESDILTRATFSGSGTGLTGYDRQPGIVTLSQQRLTVAELLAQGQTNQNTIRYVQEVSFTNAATTVAEGATKPEATFDLVEVDAAVRKVAVTAKITDETLEDFAEIKSYIDGRLMFMVEQEEEDQLLNGDGTAPNIGGILDFAIQTQAFATNMAESILKAANKVRYTGFMEPDAVVIHPTDWEALMLAKDANNQYYGGGYFSGAYGNGGYVETPRLWGLRTVVTAAISAGDPLVGAFKLGGQVFYRNGLSIDMTNSNEDDFKKNLVALRAEQRLALAVYRPLAFCQVITT
ncbi:MAG: phage major capsid protein [Ilumatobacteraceae bacterium]